MNQEIIPFRPAGSPSIPDRVARVELYGALLADADCDAARKARVKDVAALARYLGSDDPVRSLDLVVAGTPGQANTIALGFKADQLAKKLAPNTINRRLSTLRRAVRADDDATLEELASAAGVACRASMVHRTLVRLEITRKKSRGGPPSRIGPS